MAAWRMAFRSVRMDALRKDSFDPRSAMRKSEEEIRTLEWHIASSPMSSFQRKLCIGCLKGSKKHLHLTARSHQIA